MPFALWANDSDQEAKDAKPASMEDPNYTIVPSTVVRGKDYNVVVRPRADCKDDSAGPLKSVHVDLGGVSGVTPTDMGGDTGCFLRFKLSLADDTPLGPLNVPLVKQPDSQSAKITLAILSVNVAATDRGPIPPGLEEQADIFWKVLPRRAASDSFGHAFVNRYFAIEVTIGNDTGYDLQITGVAFQPPAKNEVDAPVPSDSYNVGRSTIEREQEVGSRALIVNSIKAIGPIMSGGSAFFFNTGALARWSGVNAIISGPFEKGVELVFPDKTVRQLNALDNRALRDSVVIPNNISQRILVFMSRELVECHKGQTGNGCAWSANNPSYGRLEQKKNFDPLEVMRRLGTLAIVGKKIQYLNRVRIVSTPQPIVSPPPVAQPSSELNVAQGEQNKAFSLTGTGLRGAGVALEAGVSKLKITDVAPNADGTHVDFKASADTDCPPKKYKLYVATPTGTQTLEITVTAQAPKPDKSTDAKANPAPAFLTQGDSKKAVAISGVFLDNVTASIINADAKKITKIDTSSPAPGDGKQSQTLTLTLTIANDAKPGKYPIELTRFGQTADLDFEIKGLTPTVTKPLDVTGKNTGAKPFQLVITGTNLATASVRVPDGSTISVKITSATATQLTCDVDTSKAKAGDSAQLTIVNGDATATSQVKFTVAP